MFDNREVSQLFLVNPLGYLATLGDGISLIKKVILKNKKMFTLNNADNSLTH